MQSCSGCGTKTVRGHTSLLPSLTGVKGPSGFAVRQNSEGGPVQGLIVLELTYKEEGKFWDWIFGKFPDRTLARVRTRWTMVQRRVNKLPPADGQAAAQALCAYLSPRHLLGRMPNEDLLPLSAGRGKR